MNNYELFTSARLSSLSLTYYARCLANGNYTVKLYFAEIVLRNNRSFYSLGRRIFDIYIQEKLLWKDFDIQHEAQGVDTAVVREFKAVVRNKVLQIRFHWAAKGTTAVPKRGTYGPLISAISVKSDFSPPDYKKFIVVGAVVSALLLIFMILGIRMWIKKLGRISREKELRGSDLQTGFFTYRQIKAATNNFDAANKIGEGGFGSVYKALVLQRKDNLMELVDPKLGSRLKNEEALGMIKVTLLCTNALLAFRPNMFAVVSMLEGQTIVDEVTMDPSIYGEELGFDALKDRFEQLQPAPMSTSGSESLMHSSDMTWAGSSSTST